MDAESFSHIIESCLVFEEPLMVRRSVTSRLPTRYGEFRLYAYLEALEDEEARVHLALTKGPLDGDPSPLVRVHSECLTGDVLSSQPVRLWRAACARAHRYR